MPWRFEKANFQVAELQLLVIFHRLNFEFGLGAATHHNLCTDAVSQFDMSGQKVGVEVCQHDVLNREAQVGGVLQILLDISLRINHQGLFGARVGHKVRGMC